MLGEAVSFTCPRCHSVSHNPNDLHNGYCGACHDFTAANPDVLEIWTVYEKPRDTPAFRFVVRVHEVRAGVSGPTGRAWGAQTLEDIRSIIPHHLHRLDRMDGDDPVIVETWL